MLDYLEKYFADTEISLWDVPLTLEAVKNCSITELMNCLDESILKTFYQTLTVALKPVAGKKVLDVGCYVGWFSFLLAEAEATVTGVESDPVIAHVAEHILKLKDYSNCTIHTSEASRFLRVGRFQRVQTITAEQLRTTRPMGVLLMDAQFLQHMASMFKWEVKGRNIGVENCLWEVWGLRVYDKVVKPANGDVVIDAGAHIGSFTVRASQMVGETGKVIAFEPSIDNYKWLILNTQKLENVQVFNTALWSANKTIDLFVSEYPYVGISAFETRVKTAVPAVTLDGIVAGKVNFIKIDVEGSELEVLKGAERILEENHPYIVMEIHGWELISKVESFLSGFGYRRLDDDLVFAYH